MAKAELKQVNILFKPLNFSLLYILTDVLAPFEVLAALNKVEWKYVS